LIYVTQTAKAEVQKVAVVLYSNQHLVFGELGLRAS